MDRDTALTVGLALLAVLALGVAAATIDTAVTAGGDGGIGGGGGDGSGIGPDDPDRLVGQEDSASSTRMQPLISCYPELRQPPALLGLLLVAATFFGLTYRDTKSVFASATVAGSLSIPVLLLWYLFAFCNDGSASSGEFAIGLGNQTEDDGILPKGGGSSGLGDSAAETITTPTGVFTLLVVVAILASIVLLLTAGSDDEPDGVPSVPDDEAEEEADVVELGRTAGDAADRIEADADVDNEVFGAWREMTEALDVARPESSTPAEFADAAIAAGMDRDHVVALTDVFEEVRYGGAEPTRDRERRAVDALRAIEATYANGEGTHAKDEKRHAEDGTTSAEGE